MEIWLLPFAMFGMGMFVMFLALTLFSEYRKAFMADPMAVMTLDVFLAAMRRGGPAVIAVIALFGGAMLAASAAVLVAALVLYEMAHPLRASRAALGI